MEHHIYIIIKTHAHKKKKKGQTIQLTYRMILKGKKKKKIITVTMWAQSTLNLTNLKMIIAWMNLLLPSFFNYLFTYSSLLKSLAEKVDRDYFMSSTKLFPFSFMLMP